jgi:hypothetical protein
MLIKKVVFLLSSSEELNKKFSELYKLMDELISISFEGHVHLVKGPSKQFLGRFCLTSGTILFGRSEEDLFDLFFDHFQDIGFMSEPEQLDWRTDDRSYQALKLSEFEERWKEHEKERRILIQLAPPENLRLKVNGAALFKTPRNFSYFELQILGDIRDIPHVKDLLAQHSRVKAPILRALISLRRKNAVLVLN